MKTKYFGNLAVATSVVQAVICIALTSASIWLFSFGSSNINNAGKPGEFAFAMAIGGVAIFSIVLAVIAGALAWFCWRIGARVAGDISPRRLEIAVVVLAVLAAVACAWMSVSVVSRLIGR